MEGNYVIIRTCLLSGLIAFCLGCSGGTGGGAAEGRVKPRGRILENGLPLKVDASQLPPGDVGLQVKFIKIGGVDAGTEYDARITDVEKCMFELVGTDGKGIPPGKYRVAIRMGAFSLGDEDGGDLLKGRFSRERSKIEIEVKEGEDVVIDIAQYSK